MLLLAIKSAKTHFTNRFSSG